MQAVRAAREFIARDKKHDTEVREIFNPAVTKEVIIPRETEETIIAIDRELHQRHYQTRVQPIEDKQVLEEEHRHNILPVEHRVTKDIDEDFIKRKLEEERLQFKSTREVLPVQRTRIEGATITGEHAHHHVYEQIQPVIEREIIQPSVIHTTIPIHERIERPPTFHPVTIQPRMTLEEYKRAGGVLEGKGETVDMFEGEPEIRENGGANQTYPYGHGHGKKHLLRGLLHRSSHSSHSSASSSTSSVNRIHAH